MKFKQEFIKRKIDEDTILIPVLNSCTDYKGIISLNDMAEKIFDMISEEKTEEEIVKIITGEYEVTEEQVKSDVKKIIMQFNKLGVL